LNIETKGEKMQYFKNILFVSSKLCNGLDALKKALFLAFNNKAALQVLIMVPKFPEVFKESQYEYEKFLLEKLNLNIQLACNELKINQKDINLSASTDHGDATASYIIQHVLRDAYDLVIKQAEETLTDTGFKALDMELLRKCPCPVLLNRIETPQTDKMRIAVAIDARSPDAVGHDLVLQLLKLSQELSEAYNAEISIVSCWHYEFESEFKEGGNFPISKESLKEILDEVERDHKSRFDALIKESNLRGKYKGYALKGIPDETIPTFVKANGINLLVMGTVARGGIMRALLGNTAENVFQSLKCSLIVKKPNGFISPVKAYEELS